jgi:hypothetical protein
MTAWKPTRSGGRRDKSIVIKLTKEERIILEQEADRLDRTLSDAVRHIFRVYFEETSERI